MPEDLRRRLANNRQQRDDLGQEERDLIAEAWRAKIHPAEIADLIGRSLAHVRKLRPDDVPPLRMGGGAATKKSAPQPE